MCQGLKYYGPWHVYNYNMKTFFTIVLILVILRWLLKPVIKFTVHTTLNKMADQAMRQQQQIHQTQNKSEGTISVDYIPSKEKRGNVSGNNKAGDYVDYEELK